MDSRWYIVTGASSGIGLQITRQLTRSGRGVVMACRNVAKARAATADLDQRLLAVMEVDLADMASINHFVDTILQKGYPLAALINNAGVMADRYRLTKDGFEQDMAVNFLAPIVLTNRILAAIPASTSFSIVNTVSVTCKIGKIQTQDMLRAKETDFGRFTTYADSKLALLIYTYELSQRYTDTSVRVNAVDPGVVDTAMITMGRWFDPLADCLFRPFIRTSARAAQITIAALDSDKNGCLFRGRVCEPIAAKIKRKNNTKEFFHYTNSILNQIV